MFPSEEGFLCTPDNNYNSTLLSAVLLNPPSITLDTTVLPADQAKRIIFSLSEMLRLFQEKYFPSYNMLMRHVSENVVQSNIYCGIIFTALRMCNNSPSVGVESVKIPELVHRQNLLLELVLEHEVHEGVRHLVQAPHGPGRPLLAAVHLYSTVQYTY